MLPNLSMLKFVQKFAESAVSTGDIGYPVSVMGVLAQFHTTLSGTAH